MLVMLPASKLPMAERCPGTGSPAYRRSDTFPLSRSDVASRVIIARNSLREPFGTNIASGRPTVKYLGNPISRYNAELAARMVPKRSVST